MVDVIDLLQCLVCGVFYTPKATATGRVAIHCILPVEHGLSLGQHVEAAAIEMDFSVIEARVLGHVVGPLLTGSILDMEV